MGGAGDVREAWGRVVGRLERHDPGRFAALGGPGDAEAVRRAELAMGLELPEELRWWFLANDLDAAARSDAQPCVVTHGCDVPLPGGGLLLGLTDVQSVHRRQSAAGEAGPSPEPDRPLWRREWVPIAAERDGYYGTFLDTVHGTVGTWSEPYGPEEGVYASLAAFFQQTADLLEGVSTGDWSGPGRPARPRAPERTRPEDEPIRHWARAHGLVVHDRGRIPAAVRMAFEQLPE
ncbi:histone-like nucleoid-structuring protein Lsr2 [Kitasatospora sp. NPDC096077]|uniref:Lsr2 family DNA-binding protein n=1 Tax=Kitasatospora sp. NPDC096077 TaxID=3155544 RepID=UPI00333208A2